MPKANGPGAEINFVNRIRRARQPRVRATAVHLVEVGGQGGVFQHTLALAHQFVGQGLPVVIHTADDCEIINQDINYCFCFSWQRGMRFRVPRIAFRYLFFTLPHLMRETSGLIWIQGTFKALLTFVAIALLKLANKDVFFSPHNLFSRSGSRMEFGLIWSSIKAADLVVVYNSGDAKKVDRYGVTHLQIELEMYPPIVGDETVKKWASRLGDNKFIVASIGQIRSDKNIGLLVESCAQAGARLVVMGPEAGGASAVKEQFDLSSSDVLWLEGYHELEDLAAVTALSDCVALAYSLSSQSAAASLAKAYGTSVMAHGTGGLGEQADAVVATLDVEDWSAAIQKLSRGPWQGKRSFKTGPILPTMNALPEELKQAVEQVLE